MNILLIGNGKMGKSISQLAPAQGHVIIDIVKKNDDLEQKINLNKNIDIAIEFSSPISAFGNIKTCIENNIPVVTGTTGWYDQSPVSNIDQISTPENNNGVPQGSLEQIYDLVEKYQGSFLYASNFSIGMNMAFYLTKITSQVLKGHIDNISIDEYHHLEKKDSPSGTAITLFDEVKSQIPKFKDYITIERPTTYMTQEREEMSMPEMPMAQICNLCHDKLRAKDENSQLQPKDRHRINKPYNQNSIDIHSYRQKDEIGRHQVTFKLNNELITISHQALDRKAFSEGALGAAKWLVSRKGAYTMKDVLGLSSMTK